MRLKEYLHGDKFDASERSVRKFVADIRKELKMDIDGFLPLDILREKHRQTLARLDLSRTELHTMDTTSIYPILTVMAVTCNYSKA